MPLRHQPNPTRHSVARTDQARRDMRLHPPLAHKAGSHVQRNAPPTPRAAGRPLAPSTTPLPPRPRVRGSWRSPPGRRWGCQTPEPDCRRSPRRRSRPDPSQDSAAKPKRVQTPHPREATPSAKVPQCPTTSLDAREALGYPFVAQDKSPTFVQGQGSCYALLPE